MALAKRIIPCLDIKDGRTVKGINFKSLRDAGDPVYLAKKYAEEGADELVFLDISATEAKRKTLSELVRRIAQHCNIPFTVGGGIQSIWDVELLLKSGADKITINSAAVINPQLIEDVANKFGSQCLVVAIDAYQEGNEWWVYTTGGKNKTSKQLFAWANEVENRGAGEILFTSMNNDGTKDGFSISSIKKLTTKLSIPVIASGGAGTINHFRDVFKIGNADAALAASVFHYNEIGIQELKYYLKTNQIPIR